MSVRICFSLPSPLAGKFFLLAALIMGCLFSGLGPSLSLAAASSDPLSAVVMAQQGIDQSDVDLFNQAVDVDSVLNKASGTLNTALREQLAAGKIGGSAGAMVMLLSSGEEDSAQAGLMKQFMISEVKSFVAAGVSGGYFAGKPNGRVKPERGTLAGTLPKMSKGRKELVPGKVLSQQDDKATVSATFNDAKAGRFPLTLGLERRSGNWRVTEIANAAELLKEATNRGQ